MQNDAPPLTDAEIAQLQIRVIALDNLLTVLLAGASEHQLELARDVAAYTSPRSGSTPHRPTVGRRSSARPGPAAIPPPEGFGRAS